MMYGYYGSDGWSGLWSVGMHVHMFFGLMLFVAFLGVLIWLFRFAKEAQLKKMIWACLVVGVLGVLLTAPFAYWGMRNMMEDFWEDRNGEDSAASDFDDDDRYRGMMNWWYDEYQEDQSQSSTESTDSTESVAEPAAQ